MKKREAKIPRATKVMLLRVVERLIELTTATNKPDEAKKWRTERAKYYPTPKEVAPPPREKK